MYFNQLEQLPGWHLILVIVGMFVLLAGVWAVSAQATVEESDSTGEFDVEDQTTLEREGVTPDINPHMSRPSYPSSAVRPHTMTDALTPRLIAPSMDRQVRSEGAILPQRSLSVHTDAISPQFSSSNQVDFPPLSPTTSPSSRQHPAISDISASMHTITSLHQQQAPNVLSPAGLTIGLSPVSPGFGPLSLPRITSRRISGPGHGFAAVVNQTMSLTDSTGRRKRAVSAEQERHFDVAQDGGECNSPYAELSQQEMGVGAGTAGREGVGSRMRWTWIRDIFLRRNARIR